MALTQIVNDGLGASLTVTSEGGAVTTSVQQGLAKAWVNFDGTGTIAIRDSLNVSGLVDNGTGDYNTTFIASLANVNYTHNGMAGSGTSNLINISQNRASYVPTTSAARYTITYANTNMYDSQFVGPSIHGDLA